MTHEQQMKAWAEATENALEEYLPRLDTAQAKVQEAMRYGVLGGGKRLRPVLTYAFCKACGGRWEEAKPFACALEMVHNYSLIHDDLPCMDDDTLRRGKPTNHVMFGEDFAVLAGDGLLTAAFETALSASDILPTDIVVKATAVLARSAGVYGMLGGQAIDVRNDGRLEGLDALLEMYSMKTGALLRCAAEMGCVVAGATKLQRKAAVTYADKLGLAFQIRDDILDITGDAAVFGKPIGSDASQGKTTYPALVGLEQAEKDVQRLTNEALQSLDAFEDASFLTWLARFLVRRDY